MFPLGKLLVGLQFPLRKHFIQAARSRNISQAFEKPPALVIFDKDGTLMEYGAGFKEWALITVDLFSKRLQKPIHTEFFTLIGYDAKKDRFTDGLLNGQVSNILRELKHFLVLHGMPDKQAAATVDQMDLVNISDELGQVKPIGDPKALISKLKLQGTKVAICTSDSAPGNDIMLETFNIGHLIDFNLCGDDPLMKPKPDPHNIELICAKLGVSMRESVMVGDSARDMEMGRLAHVRLNVGVLSGVGTEEQLAAADLLLPSIKELTPVLLEEDQI